MRVSMPLPWWSSGQPPPLTAWVHTQEKISYFSKTSLLHTLVFTTLIAVINDPFTGQ